MLAGILRRLTYKEIRATADAYLRRYAPDRGLVVDIEMVVDCRLGIDIVPVPGLERQFLIDGLYDLYQRQFYVDADECRRKTNRYRFTLAHELGHLALHAEHLQTIQASPAEYLRLLSEVPSSVYTRLEREASSFAGLFLLPASSLRSLLREVRTVLPNAVRDDGSIAVSALNEVTDHIGRRAGVSRQVVLIRGFYDGHWPRQP